MFISKDSVRGIEVSCFWQSHLFCNLQQLKTNIKIDNLQIIMNKGRWIIDIKNKWNIPVFWKTLYIHKQPCSWYTNLNCGNLWWPWCRICERTSTRMCSPLIGICNPSGQMHCGRKKRQSTYYRICSSYRKHENVGGKRSWIKDQP